MTTITHLECSLCGKQYEAGRVHNVCECGGPLSVRYDLVQVRQGWSREWLNNAPPTMWRYAAVLPVGKPGSIVSLGEGMSPLVRCRNAGARLGLEDLWVKDDGVNPTGSFKDYGMTVAVSQARRLGSRVMSRPKRRIVPAFGLSSPAIRLAACTEIISPATTHTTSSRGESGSALNSPPSCSSFRCK